MGLRTTIANGVDTAFKSLSDLVVTAVFDEEIVDSFDFTTNLPESSVEPLYVEMIPTETVTKDGSTLRTKFVARSTDFDISKYSIFTVSGQNYNIESLEIYEGVYIIEATRVSSNV